MYGYGFTNFGASSALHLAVGHPKTALALAVIVLGSWMAWHNPRPVQARVQQAKVFIQEVL